VGHGPPWPAVVFFTHTLCVNSHRPHRSHRQKILPYLIPCLPVNTGFFLPICFATFHFPKRDLLPQKEIHFPLNPNVYMKPSPLNRLLLLSAFAGLAATTTVNAGILFWDGTDSGTVANANGGNGTWDTVTANWDSVATAGVATIWPNSGTDDDATFAGTAGTVTIAAGGVTANDLTFSTTGYTIGGAGLTLNGTLPVISVSGTATINSSITTAVAGGFSKTGTGTLILGSANTFAANTNLAFGTGTANLGAIRIAHGSALSGITTITSANNNTGVSRLELIGGITVTGTAINTGGRSAQQTTGAILANISGNNEWAGAITITGTGGAYGIRSDAGILTLSGGVRSNTATRTWDVGGTGDILISSLVGGTQSGNQTGSLSLNKFGSGTVTLSVANTFGGSTKINAGTLLLTHASALQNSTVDLATADAGTLSFGPSLTAATFGALTGSRNLSLLNTNGTPAAVTLSVGNTTATSYTYTGVLSGGNLYKIGSGAGTFTLDPGTGVSVSLNSLSANAGGAMILKSGNIATAGIDPGQAAYTMGAGVRGGTLTVDGANLTVNGSRRFVVGAAANGTSNLISGSITAAQVVLGHNGTVTMNHSGGTVTTTSMYHQDGGAGTYNLTGGTLIAQSIYNNTANAGGTQTFTLNLNGGTLRAAASTTNLIRTNNTGTQISVLLGTGNTQIDTSLSSATIARPMGDMSGQAGTFTKIGANTLTLSEASTYTGGTTVSGGTLLVTNTTGSATGTEAVSVTSGARLGGTGSIAGSVSIGASGSTLSPTAQTSGNDLNIGGNVTLTAGSIFNWDLSATAANTVAPGQQGSYGQVNAVGSVTGTASFFINLLGGVDNTTAFTDAFWSTSKSWNNVVTSTTTDLASVFTTFSGAGVNSNGTVTGDLGQFSFTGTTLNWTAVPEPSSAFLVGGLCLGGVLRRQRFSAKKAAI
jgi:autotransporter-associated beta strand protein